MLKRTIYKKILIVKPSSLGDVVHSLPFLNAIKSCFPRAEIHWVIAKGLEELLEGNPMISKVIVINKDIWKKLSKTGETIREIKNLFVGLKKEKYDLVIDLQGLLRSGLLTMATGAPVRIGFAEAREGSRFCYTLKVKGGREIHAIDRYMKLAEALGCDARDIAYPFPLFGADVTEIRKVKEALGRYAVIVPGARWSTKVWPAEYFGKIASMLPVKSIVVGSKEDISAAENVVKHSEGRAVSVAGITNIKELINLMRDASFVISNDSGPMHIAAALHVPVIAIFGPTNPVRTGPYGDQHITVKSDKKCAPCFRKRCGDNVCMKEILPEVVLNRLGPVINRLTV